MLHRDTPEDILRAKLQLSTGPVYTRGGVVYYSLKWSHLCLDYNLVSKTKTYGHLCFK